MTRVLIVDDEPAVRAALDRALRLDGYEVELAADGREALDRLADVRHDAVVLDVAMPGIDGLEVCRRLRRAETPESEDGHALRFADLTLDQGAWEARRGSRKLELSRTEFQLLALFLEHPRQVLTRSQIFERVWGYDFGSSSNSLGVYMGYLRRKTEEGGEPRLLHKVRGVGYVLR